MRRIKIVLSLIIATVALLSCNKGSSGLTFTSYATTVITSNDGGYPFYFVTDDSVKIYPKNYLDMEYDPVTGDRFLLTFNELTYDDSYNQYATITNYFSLYTKNIISSTKPDTLGTDGATPVGLWYSGGVYGAPRYVNINFIVMVSQSEITHTINLVRDTLASEMLDEDGYYPVNFHHNANDDYPMYQSEGLFSFPLPDDLTQPGIKGLKIRFNNIIDKQTTSYKLDY